MSYLGEETFTLRGSKVCCIPPVPQGDVSFPANHLVPEVIMSFVQDKHSDYIYLLGNHRLHWNHRSIALKSDQTI